MSEITAIVAREELQFLRIHLEPSGPVEVEELTKALDGLARQYNQYIDKHPTFGPATDAKLYVSSISPGSIDIALLPDLASVAGILKSAFEPITLIIEFAKHIREFIGSFSAPRPPDPKIVSVEDCDDAINIAAPIANHGGSQTISIVNGDIHNYVLTMNASDARKLSRSASVARATIRDQKSADEIIRPFVRQRVPLLWSRLDRRDAKTEGKQSPDKGIIEEIDPSPRPVFFTDEMLYLKNQMIGDDENPYQRLYFVDVEVSLARGRVASYRVVGFHGTEELGT